MRVNEYLIHGGTHLLDVAGLLKHSRGRRSEGLVRKSSSKQLPPLLPKVAILS